MNINNQTSTMAAEVISASGPDRPADRVLKERLRRVSPTESHLRRDISEAVFAWFKWWQWLGETVPNASSIQKALETHANFQSHPQSFDMKLLRQKVIPAWCHDCVKVTDAWILHLQQTPQVWLRSRPEKRGDLIKELGGGRLAVPGPWKDALSYKGDLDLFRTEAFHRGAFEIQDINSQAVGLACRPKSGETWWDVCSGEGGKMLHLSDMMQNKGLIWATDPVEWRLQRLKRRAARAKIYNYRAVHWRNTETLPTKNRFDGILVDAPCSGVGTWQRNPHARWTTTPKDVEELACIQARLLALGAKALKPGGKLIYSVCTLTHQETETVADKLDAEGLELEPLPLINPFSPKQQATPRLWLEPNLTGGNGMFVAGWRRKE